MVSDTMNVEDNVSRSAEDSSPSTVQLEIYIDWWWWSGFLRAYPWKLAETDGPRFYDLAAFPTLKPDIDLFGVPQRSRKQRGWYQILAPVSGQPTPLIETHRAVAMASDIPPELFENILEKFRWDKHALARCGQVCRYWARECRQMLFAEVNLRGREDVSHLLHLMRDPTSDVSCLVTDVETPLAQNVPSAPWIHLLPLIKDRSRHPDGMDDFLVRLSGPLPPGQRSLRSIHYALPRVLPHFSRHISELHLTDLHFSKLDDLVHLVCEMPHLHILKCIKVTWRSFLLTPPRRKPLGYSIQTHLDRECGPRPVEAGVWLSTSVLTSLDDDIPVLSIDDSARVLAIARAIDKTATSALALSVVYFSGGFQMHIGEDVEYIGFHDEETPQSVPAVIHKVVMRFRSLPSSSLDAQPAFFLRNLDWAIVGSTLSSFPGLRRVIVGLVSREDMVEFDNIARVYMSRLHGTSVFKYALWDPNGGNPRGSKKTWLQASLDSDETEPSGEDEDALCNVYRYNKVLPAVSQSM